ncbi:MAG TPA: response regulator [Candidatus Hydrogenedentes bacterium]|nr:response regulator [Candidatus Hydrogenedentota bacterium]HNT87928.1 response regulator [Candidatus Hydrogenedentota bacterium]
MVGVDRTGDGMGDLRILIVSDDPLLRHMTCAWFERRAFHVAAAPDSTAAAACCERNGFDAVIVDFDMDDMQSYETVLFLRAQGRDRAIIALLTSVEERFSALICGATRALVKPVPLHQLEEEVRQACDHVRARYATAQSVG